MKKNKNNTKVENSSYACFSNNLDDLKSEVLKR